MSSSDERTRRLQQIPVFALRKLVNEQFQGEEGNTILTERIRTVLNRKPRQARQAVMRLTRLELTQLINVCPEIVNERITEMFEQYRYGSHPSFYVFLFNPKLLDSQSPNHFADRISKALKAEKEALETVELESLPSIRDIMLNDFGRLDESPEIFEGTYRFLSRLDYVDADENAVSTYETLYGFFWINTSEGYVTIHARRPGVLNGLKRAIEQAGDIFLTALTISKQFKNALRFLERDYLRSSRLYEPDANSKRFRWLTISDRRAYAKGYEEWENAYPELRSTKYRVLVGEKRTTLTLRCDQGALSLAGRLQASEFRDWAIVSLGEVIRVLNELRVSPSEHVHTHHLRTQAEMARFAAKQKDLVLDLVSLLLASKQVQQQYQPLEISPIELVTSLSGFLQAQICCTCTEPECDEETDIVCPICGEGQFAIRIKNGVLQLNCLQRRPPHWSNTLPFDVDLECGHPFTLDSDELVSNMQVLPSAEFMSIIASVINKYLADFSFDPFREGFIIRGSYLYYYSGKEMIPQIFPDGAKTVVHVEKLHQEVENNYGHMTGVALATRVSGN